MVLCPISVHAASVEFLGVLDDSEDVVLGQKVITTSLAYGLDPMLALDVLKCESGLHHAGIYGDGGKAYGIAQFHKGTFNWFKDLAGRPDLSYTSGTDQVELFVWSLMSGKGRSWTCWRKVIYKYS